MEPFKWDYIAVDRAKLGNAADLLTTSLTSKEFWSYLKKYHGILSLKYTLDDKNNSESISDLQKLENEIIYKYNKFFNSKGKPIKMPINLSSEELWNKEASITYAASSQLRESSSTEEAASFLVRWATELFISWS